MAKPRLIILIRHAQSEGNKNREIHQTIPDHRVKLTQDGWQQAYDAGRRLRAMLRADDTLHFFTSPYRRTRETTEGILETLTSDESEPSPFKRNNIKVYEEPRLREQDFGNFQPCSAEMERMWQERADYGHFFYRIPDGESAADAYDRVSGFNESLWRQFGEDDFASVCVLVTHGLMSRVFLMKWYHFSVEYFEDLRNVNHCEFLIMRKEDSGKYKLENQLRTWSELRRERVAQIKHKEEESTERTGTGSSKDDSKLNRTASSVSSPIQPRRWGGCPNGCDHDKNFKIRSALADLVKRDGVNVYDNPKAASSSSSIRVNGNSNPHSHSHSPSPLSSGLSARRPAARRLLSSGNSDDDDPVSPHGSVAAPQIDITRAREEVVSSPDATPSYITVEDRLRSQLKSPNLPPRPFLHVGRDFGGTYSGHTSDADSSEDDSSRHRLARLKLGTHHHSFHHGHTNSNGVASLNAKLEKAEVHERRPTGMRRNTLANRLGDAPQCSDCEHENHDHSDDTPAQSDENELDQEQNGDVGRIKTLELERRATAELDAAEKEDKSIQGSVY